MRSPLRQDVLALQIERLNLTLPLGALLRGNTFSFFDSSADLRLLQGVCHLLLHGCIFQVLLSCFHFTGLLPVASRRLNAQ
jgi:hypothetical protein